MLMDGLLDWIWIAALTLAVGQAALLTAQTWEHLRFAIGRFRKPLGRRPRGRVLVVAPCRGMDVGLRDNLRPLFEQDHPDYQVRFVVESSCDPAADVIRRLIAEYAEVDAELIIAGRAIDCGQKVHNLRAATRELSDRVKLLAFVDSDARPNRSWLLNLTQRLDRSRSGAATGYRWFVPTRPSLTNWLAYSLNASAATLFGTKGYQLIWGGSWAIRRDVFERERVRQTWRGMLGDDLSATAMIHAAGLRVEFEPTCMIASPLDYQPAELASFVYRQYALARLYLPRLWLMALIWSTLSSLVLLATAGRFTTTLIQTGMFDWFAAAGLTALYGSHLVRGLVRCRIAQLYCPQHHAHWRRAARFDCVFAPLAGLVHWVGLLSGVRVRHISWRGIDYVVEAPDRVSLRTPGQPDFSAALTCFGLSGKVRREEARESTNVASMADATTP
ncbi:MAG: glycosyltransferase [Planctomycetes bacterium]|nr:glycosyltransferase [Planctomycetota bacterium]